VLGLRLVLQLLVRALQHLFFDPLVDVGHHFGPLCVDASQVKRSLLEGGASELLPLVLLLSPLRLFLLIHS